MKRAVRPTTATAIRRDAAMEALAKEFDPCRRFIKPD
jgi:hypothetical protein